MKSVVIVLLVFCSLSLAQRTLHIQHEWKRIDYVFPDNAERDRAIREGRYYFQNCTPIDVDVHHMRNGRKRTFVTFPRIGEGIPVTLGTVSDINTPNGPLIQPYPSYDWHKSYGSDCDGITSSFRIFIDACERLWVLDTGRIVSNSRCNPQILIFDLNTDQLVHRYRIPKDQYNSSTLLVTPMVNILDPPPQGRCNNARAYLADAGGASMFVYDLSRDRSWKIIHDSFKPKPGYQTFTVEGISFQFTGGLFGLAFNKEGRTDGSDGRELYYHPFSSPDEYSVPLSVLHDSNAFSNNPYAHANAFKKIGERGDVQSVAEAMDSKGNLFFGLMSPSAISCWHSGSPYKRDNLKMIARHRETLQFASGVKVIRNPQSIEELWVVTNKFQYRFSGTYDWSKFNFRILSRPINEILKGTSCLVEAQGTNIVFDD